jgi:predicted O-methyltransferase YrrM
LLEWSWQEKIIERKNIGRVKLQVKEYFLEVIGHPSLAMAYVTRTNKLCKLSGCSRKTVSDFLEQFYDSKLFSHISYQLKPYYDRSLGHMCTPLKAPIIYVLCRTIKPITVVETGVASGVSSAVILQALEDNSEGLLHSIDLPNMDPKSTLPPGKETGWIIPVELKKRWNLIIGNSIKKLPVLLQRLGTIDLFLHDSEHTYANMLEEYTLSWPHIKRGRILLSDDVHDTTAFQDFCKHVSRTPVLFNGLGGVRK